MVIPNLENIFLNHLIKNEWNAFVGEQYQYSPRVDIAVGPFNIAPGPNLRNEYNRLMRSDIVINFLQTVIEYHNQNIDRDIYQHINHAHFDDIIRINQNSRCLLAIEIENTNSKKHMMGSIINAASLGRIGIGIAYYDSAHRTFLRIVNYLKFLRSVGKNTYNTDNFLILTVAQFNDIIQFANEE